MSTFKNSFRSTFRCLLFLLGIIAIAPAAYGQVQRQCGNEAILDYLKNKDLNGYNDFRFHHSELGAEVNNLPHYASKTTAIATIPMVFHFLMTQNMLDEIGGTAGIEKRIASQLEVLNEDFSANNPDQLNTPAPFRNAIAISFISFKLAEKDSLGNPSRGYTLRMIATTEDSTFPPFNGAVGSGTGGSDAKYNLRGIKAWPINCYLNVWVGQLGFGTYGATVSPNLAKSIRQPNERGVVMDYRAFGKRENAADVFFKNIDLGRTMTHEIGHYFELFHIWGDDQGACPGDRNYQDDDIADTPDQAGPNTGCPSFPRTSCSSAGPNGDMFMNYMDYCDDRCIVMFTFRQCIFMLQQTLVGKPSFELANCGKALNLEAGGRVDLGINVYPNPAFTTISIAFQQASSNPVSIKVSNLVGQVLESRSIAAQDNKVEIDVANLPRGVYLLEVTSATASYREKVILR